jgi:hypothetical protein
LTFSSRSASASRRPAAPWRAGHDLQQVVLHDVAQRADLVVEPPRPSTPKSSAMVICTLEM